jgi:2,4-dienoyl-CoA reductase-like NADH-dependent reductase (Old Yellow Enzyme family)
VIASKLYKPRRSATQWPAHYEQAEAIIGTGDADLVALARAILYDPRWPWHAAAHFGDRVKAPNQYLRCQPRQHAMIP